MSCLWSSFIIPLVPSYETGGPGARNYHLRITKTPALPDEDTSDSTTMMERHSPSRSPYASSSPHSQRRRDERRASRDRREPSSLPPPTTYNEYKRSRQENEKMASAAGVKIKPAGESGRRGIHPWQFLRIAFRSSCRASLLCNILWPIVPAALAVRCKL